MMTSKEQKKYFKTILKYLQKEELKVAIELLETFIKKNNLGIYNSNIEVIDRSYSSLLAYFIKGSEDQERQKYIQQLKDDILSLTIRVSNKARNELKYSNYSIMREYSLSNTAQIEGILENKNKLTIENAESIIEYTLYYEELKKWNSNLFKTFLDDLSIPDYYQGAWVGVFTLNMIQEFQWEKFEFLGQLLTHDKIEINQRALVGIFLIMLLHKDIMPFYSQRIRDEILPLVNNEEIILLLLQFIRAQDTERIEHRINKDILPNMVERDSLIREKLSELEEEEMDEPLTNKIIHKLNS